MLYRCSPFTIYICFTLLNFFSELLQSVALLSLSLSCSQGRTVSCVPADFSDWKTLIPRPSMCVGSVTVTLLELSMEARHVHRYILHNIHSTPFAHYFHLLVGFNVAVVAHLSGGRTVSV